jgi:cytochrome c
MKKILIFISAFVCLSYANSDLGEKLFIQKCATCHTNKLINPSNKKNLAGPPIDEVLMHVKQEYKNQKNATAFIVDYIFNPSYKKALCASMDKFGLMPSLKGLLTKNEAKTIAKYLYKTYPRKNFIKKDKKLIKKVNFKTLDTNNDGKISPKEFREFRAKKNNINPNSFKQDLFFKKVDLNGDGFLDKKEFKKFLQHKLKHQ